MTGSLVLLVVALVTVLARRGRAEDQGVRGPAT